MVSLPSHRTLTKTCPDSKLVCPITFPEKRDNTTSIQEKPAVSHKVPGLLTTYGLEEFGQLEHLLKPVSNIHTLSLPS